MCFDKLSTNGLVPCRRLFAGVELRQCGLGFIPPETHPEFAAHKSKAQEALRLAEEAMEGGRYDLIVLDEVCVAVAKRLIEEDRVIELARRTPEGSRLALTGRGATERLIALADTATEMRCIKHGLLDGRIAQEGVEY